MPTVPARTTVAPTAARRSATVSRPSARSLPAADAGQVHLAELIAQSPHQAAQRRTAGVIQRTGALATVPRRTGDATDTAPPASDTPRRAVLPAPLRAGIEALSGLSMAHVQVHHGSPEPARVGAEAFAQGSKIHLAPGQDHHLPHDAWHIVQQAQGRVRPTRQLAGGPPVNDEAGLEREADAMGARALAAHAAAPRLMLGTPASTGAALLQRKIALPVWGQQILPNLGRGVRITVTQDSDQTEKLVAKLPNAAAPLVKVGAANPVALGNEAAFIDQHSWNHKFTRVVAPDEYEHVDLAPTVTPTGVVEGGEGPVPMHVEEPVGDPHAFIHHSFSTYSTGKNAKAPRVRREGGHHLTVENTHLLALLTLKESGSMLGVKKSGLDKKIVNDKLRAKHLSDLDNLNFFPDKPAQTSTNLRPGLSGLDTKRLPQLTDDPTGEDVDKRITMQEYVSHIAKSMQAIPDASPLYGAKMLHTLHTLHTLRKMGEATRLDPSRLYLKTAKNDQRHLLRAVLIIAAQGLNEGLRLPDTTRQVFARYTGDVPELPYLSTKTQQTEWVRMGGITDIPDVNYNVLEKKLVAEHYTWAWCRR